MMDHSVAGYLRRQDSQKLEMLLESYMMTEKSAIRDDVIRIILEILKERGDEVR